MNGFDKTVRLYGEKAYKILNKELLYETLCSCSTGSVFEKGPIQISLRKASKVLPVGPESTK